MKKADVIRGVLQANPEGKLKDLAKVAARKYGGEVKPVEVSNYKSQMRKAGLLNGVAPTPAPAPAPAHVEKPAAPRPAPVAVSRQTMTVLETVELVRDLVHQLGKDELKKLVDVL